MAAETKIKPLNSFEKYVAELTWGGIPTDVSWVRESSLFKAKYKELENKKDGQKS
jgi:hypothetical protein